MSIRPISTEHSRATVSQTKIRIVPAIKYLGRGGESNSKVAGQEKDLYAAQSPDIVGYSRWAGHYYPLVYVVYDRGMLDAPLNIIDLLTAELPRNAHLVKSKVPPKLVIAPP
jgi:hypothetical protein